MYRSRFSSAMIPYAIPTRKLRDCLKQNSSKKPTRKREPVQNPKLRYFKPFEFFDHAGYDSPYRRGLLLRCLSFCAGRSVWMEYDLSKKATDCTSAVAFLVAGARKQGASEEAPLF